MSIITRKYPEVDPKKDSTFYLWDVYFLITVNQLDITTEDYIKQLGFVDAGDAEINKVVATEMITTKANIATMAEYFKKGINFYVRDKNDTPVIYEYIQNHLEKFANQASGLNLNKANLPLDDLLILEELADKLYGYAKYIKTGHDTRGKFRNLFMLDDSSFTDPSTLFNLPKTEEEKKEEEVPEQRESFMDLFKTKQNEVDRLWN